MNTDAHRYDGPQAQLTFAIIGCAMDVLNGLGAGLHEKPCENALVVELTLHGIASDQQRRFAVEYKGGHVGEYVPDLTAGPDRKFQTPPARMGAPSALNPSGCICG